MDADRSRVPIAGPCRREFLAERPRLFAEKSLKSGLGSGILSRWIGD